jgi:hypothetical protein
MIYTYLHKSLRIIACPLLESSASRKTTQARERWNHGNSGALQMRIKTEKLWVDLPSINVVEDLVGLCLTMGHNKIFINPRNKMILEYTLDELMQDVWGNKLLNISAGEIVCKRL